MQFWKHDAGNFRLKLDLFRKNVFERTEYFIHFLNFRTYNCTILDTSQDVDIPDKNQLHDDLQSRMPIAQNS